MSLLADLRILVVEDEVLIAVEIEERLQRLGCEIVGPVGRLERALELARTTALDGALLEVNIKGGLVYRVAEELLTREVPVVFSTGYALNTLPPAFQGLPCLRKPFRAGQLEAVAREAFVGRRGKINPDCSSTFPLSAARARTERGVSGGLLGGAAGAGVGAMTGTSTPRRRGPRGGAAGAATGVLQMRRRRNKN